MLDLDLLELLNAATDEEDAIIRAVLYRAEVLWKCRNTGCPVDMPRTEHRCSQCGYDRDGRPIGDRVPSTYGPIPDALLTALRTALAEWFTENGRPRPDAVTFTYTNQNEAHEWSDWGVLHFGGRVEPYCDFDGSDVAEALTELSEWEAPHWCDELTIAVPR
ncbi:hypothetical protein ACFV9E_03270 [Streptomyces sp. NPDC059835]|uniref:hypothetical protein n=1 Tax=unclassified Streptomyces TaxID=2593676 RepID=UPI0036687624